MPVIGCNAVLCGAPALCMALYNAGGALALCMAVYSAGGIPGAPVRDIGAPDRPLRDWREARPRNEQGSCCQVGCHH